MCPSSQCFLKKAVGLSDGERYVTTHIIYYLLPTQLSGMAVPCDAMVGNLHSGFESPAKVKVDIR